MAFTVDGSAIVNQLYNEITGSTDISLVDNTNIVDIGRQLQSMTSTDNLYSKIYNKVGLTIIENKYYKGDFQNLYKTMSEYGSIIELLRVKPFVATKDPSRNPTAGTYNKFTQYNPAEIEAKYIENESAWQIEYWKPTDQLWSAFKSVEAMNSFINNGIVVQVMSDINARLEALASNAIANMIGETVYHNFPTPEINGYNANSFPTCQNIRKLYNDLHPDHQLTVAQCLAMNDESFVKFFVKTVLDTRKRLTRYSKVFNIEGATTFTSPEDINLTILDPVNNAMTVNVYSSVYHKELLSLGNFNTVPYWQSSGQSYDTSILSEVNVKIKTPDGTNPTVEFPGVLAVLYDKEAVICFNEHRKATSFYNPDIDMTFIQDKYRSGYANVLDRNFVVFYVA